jgi:hypothetical protein
MRHITALLLLFSATTQAQDFSIPEVPAIPEGRDVIEALTLRQPAPHAGMLLDTDTAIRWTNALRWWPETFRLRMAHLEVVFREVLDSAERRRTVEVESLGREISGLRNDLRTQAQRYERELAVLRNPPFRHTRAFGFVSGFTLAVLLLVGGGLLALAL